MFQIKVLGIPSMFYPFQFLPPSEFIIVCAVPTTSNPVVFRTIRICPQPSLQSFPNTMPYTYTYVQMYIYIYENVKTEISMLFILVLREAQT